MPKSTAQNEVVIYLWAVLRTSLEMDNMTSRKCSVLMRFIMTVNEKITLNSSFMGLLSLSCGFK